MKNKLNKEKFINKYIITETDKILFNNIKEILSKNILAKNKQRRIEKLMNIYSLKKQEKLLEMNPFWKNTIFLIFNNELIHFEKIYEYFKNIKRNDYFNSEKLNIIFTIKELFNLTIYTFIKNSNNYNSLTENNLLKSTYISKLTVEIYKYFEQKISIIVFKKYFDEILKKNYTNIELDKLILKIETNYLTFKKDYVINWTDILFYLLESKQMIKNFNKKSNLYKEEKIKFLNYLNDQKEIILKYITKMSNYIIHFFINELEIFKIFKRIKDYKTYDYLKIFNLEKFNKLNHIYYISNQLPMICEPLNWNYNGFNGGYLLNKNNKITSLTKSLSHGKSKIKYSKYFIDSINIIQKKEYIIDKNYLKYIKTNLFFKDFGIKTLDEIYSLYEKYWKNFEKYHIYLLQNELNLEIFEIYNKKKYSIINSNEYRKKNEFEKIEIKNQLKKELNINEEFINLYKELILSEEDLYKSINMYKHYWFILNFSEIFINEKIYIVNRCDFRGRFYPVGRGLHRASGLFKYLLIDEIPYQHNKTSIEYLKEYIVINYKQFGDKYTKKDLINWFDNNIETSSRFSNSKIINFLNAIINTNENLNINIDNFNFDINLKQYITNLYNLIISAKEPSLFLFGLIDYFNFKKDNKFFSTLLIDIDQSSSGPMIYSLLSQDKKMSHLTNVITENNEIRKDLYNHYLIQLKNLLDLIKKEKCFKQKVTNNNNVITIKTKKLEEEDEIIIIDYLVNNYNNIFDRNFSKLLIMPTFYNMGKLGIKKLLYNTIRTLEDKFLIENINKFVSIFSLIIEYSLYILYKNTIEYQKGLVDICKILYDSKNEINIYTLDGSFINYKYLETINNFGQIKINNKKISYRIFLPMQIYKKEILSNQHYLTFPPNFIHSIDGAICKIICNIFFKKYAYRLEALHDSFRINFISINNLNNIIKYVYIYYFFPKFFFKYKIGFKKESTELIINSEIFDDYKKLLPKFNKNSNILYESFFNKLFVSVDIQNLLEKKFIEHQNKFKNEFNDDEIKFILNSNFMFYF